MPSAPPFHLHTLGRLALLDAEGADVLPRDVTKPLALLAYLAAAPGRRCSRERLVDLFWGDSTLEHGRASLRQVIYRLRDALGDEVLQGESTDLLLTPELRTDREAFLCALENGNLDLALSLYHGAFIEGFVSRGTTQFEQWRDQEQDRLHDLFTNTIEIAGQRAIEEGRASEAAALARRVLDDHPLDERGWRLRLQAEQLSGSRIHLTASIAEFRRLFAGEGWEPQPRTMHLIEAMERTKVAAEADGNPDALEGDLIGRDAVMAALYHQWKQAAKRVGSHSHLVGGAGMGKSRILEDFAVRIGAERGRVALVGAYPRQRYVPGAMLATLIAALAEFPGAVGVTAESARILIELQPVVSQRFLAAAPAAHRGEPQRSAVVGEALRDLVEAVTENGAVCLLLDDAHWWDEESRQYIEALIERLGDRAMLVVTASRPGTSEISTGNSGDGIELLRWQADDVLALLGGLGSTSEPEAAATLAQALTIAAEGVPLLVLEALRLGLDRNLISLHQREWRFPGLAGLLTLLRPGQLLRERTSSLSKHQRHLLLVAWLLEQAIPRDTSWFGDRDSTTGALTDLERLGFLSSNRQGWRIGHDAIGEAIEASATVDDLRSAHRDAATLSLDSEDHPIGLRQAAKHALEAGDALLQHRVAVRWVKHRRAVGSSAAAAELLREIFPRQGPSTPIRELVRELPPDLRRRPWSARRLAPIWAVGGAATVLGAFALFDQPKRPDMVLGVYGPDSSGRIVNSQIDLRHEVWGTAESARLRAQRGVPAVPWRDTPPESLSNGPIGDPSGSHWIFARTISSSDGPTELVYTSTSGERVIAAAAGDDAQPAWSPDGNFVVFQSNRWTLKGSPNFDLAIVEVATNRVRRLTSAGGDEVTPIWSPDGTRIAYISRSDRVGADSVCWITVDAEAGDCRRVTEMTLSSVLGWRNGSTVIASGQTGEECLLPTIDLDRGTIQSLITPGVCSPSLSPDATWLAWPLKDVKTARPRLAITSLTGIAATREIPLPMAADPGLGTYWEGRTRSRWLRRVTIRHRGDTLVAGSPYQLEIRGADAEGAEVAIPSSVVSWRSSDTTIAVVDASGMVHPIRKGTVRLSASAGGWRADTATLIIAGAIAAVVYSESWTGAWSSRWVLNGEPLGTLVPRTKQEPPAFLVNGDGTYTSSALSSQRFDPRRGVALDVRLSTPITQPKWQSLRVGLAAVERATRGGLVGKGACTFAYPSGEGWETHNQVSTQAGLLNVGRSLGTGAWYDVRIQLFPDGTCGFAINGQPVLRSETAVGPKDSVAITIEGQTVGSHLLVGTITVWAGVPTGVDWTTLRPGRNPSQDGLERGHGSGIRRH